MWHTGVMGNTDHRSAEDIAARVRAALTAAQQEGSLPSELWISVQSETSALRPSVTVTASADSATLRDYRFGGLWVDGTSHYGGSATNAAYALAGSLFAVVDEGVGWAAENPARSFYVNVTAEPCDSDQGANQ